MSQILVIFLLISLLLVVFSLFKKRQQPKTKASAKTKTVQQAFKNKLSDIQVSGSGTVFKILPDDLIGDKHQKFLLQLSPKQTVLVTHNIDLAPRIKNLNIGDKVEFYGEYRWSEQGGLIHWTHRDPKEWHPHGWLKHRNKTYQ